MTVLELQSKWRGWRQIRWAFIALTILLAVVSNYVKSRNSILTALDHERFFLHVLGISPLAGIVGWLLVGLRERRARQEYQAFASSVSQSSNENA